MPVMSALKPVTLVLLLAILLSACSTGGNGPTPGGDPVVTITSPGDGASLNDVIVVATPVDPTTLSETIDVLLSATANDPEEGDLSTAIQWTVDGGTPLGSGASLSTELSEGAYTVTASVTDSTGRRGQDSAAFTVEVVVASDTTTVLDAATRSSLSEVQPDGTLRFARSTPLLQGLTPGDVLVSEPTSLAPYGFLRKVVAVRQQGGALLVTTEQAKLEDAVYQGSFSLTKALTAADVRRATPLVEGVTLQTRSTTRGLTPQADEGVTVNLGEVVLFDADGDTATTDDQIVASGKVNFDPLLEIDGDLDFDCCFDVDLNFKAEVGLTERADLAITGKADAVLDVEVPIFRTEFEAITVFIGPVPIVFTPIFEVLVGADGEVSAELSFKATQQLSASVGVDCDPGCDSIGELDNDFNGEAATFTGQLKLKGYAGVKLTVLVYGVVGPYAQLDAYLELDGKVPRSPTWFLFGGIEGLVGVEIDILSFEKTFETEVFDTHEEIARAGNTPPEVEITFPAAGTEVDLNFSQGIVAEVSDLEEGDECCTVTWTSNLAGELGTTMGDFHNLVHIFKVLGHHTITATAVDGGGGSASDSITINVVNSPPGVSVQNPLPGEEIIQGQPTTLRGSWDDKNDFADGQCEDLTWTSSVEADPFPLTGCEIEVTFDSTGPRTITASATDSLGVTGSERRSVTVVEPPDLLPPSVTIVSPENNSFFPNAPTVLAAEVSDADSDAAQLRYLWTVSCPYDPETGEGGPNTETIADIVGPDGASPTWEDPNATFTDLGCGFAAYQLKLEVTDPQANTGSDFVVLLVINPE